MQCFYLPRKEIEKAGRVCLKGGFGENRINRIVTAIEQENLEGHTIQTDRSHDSNVPEVGLCPWLIGRLSIELQKDR